MKREERTFTSKILLFGEYLLLCGAKALSIPYSKYYGYLDFDKNKEYKGSNENLGKFLNYLKNINDELNLNLAKFDNELQQGIIFKSNIPYGYGLGSSGSLSAAIYDRYAFNKISNKISSSEEINKLKTLFGKMESFFTAKVQDWTH
jgi:mevalonate kinase